MKLRIMVVAFALICVATLAVAQSPFDGTWTMNQKKSQLTGNEVTFSDAGSGEIKYSDSSESYTFKPDGTPATTPMGVTSTWKKVDDNTYQHSNSMNGTTTSESTWKIAGNKATINAHGTRPNGEKWNETSTYERQGSGSGLMGTWKSTSFKMSAPATMTMKGSADGSFEWNISAEKAIWKGKMDGKDYPATGPTIPQGLTLALSQTGDRSFKVVEKVADKTVYIGEYSVTADGKTMNVKGTNGEGKEPTSEVWEKKS